MVMYSHRGDGDGGISIVVPDFNKSVKPMSEPIWHYKFIILAICYLNVSHSLGVFDPLESATVE